MSWRDQKETGLCKQNFHLKRGKPIFGCQTAPGDIPFSAAMEFAGPHGKTA
jgi:hypothetical protein